MYRSMEEAKQAAEAATAMKSTCIPQRLQANLVLANMSHEIRTPFNAVIACSVFLLDTPLTAIQKDYCETIYNSATELLRIIDDILGSSQVSFIDADFSKIEHGRLELEVHPFSLRDSVETALAVIADPAAAKNVDLGYENLHDDFPDKVLGDVTRFRQILLKYLVIG
jgi:osomolarity two-component system, sensor histidine kinase CHK1